MSNPYVGEIRMFAGNFAPAGWMLCLGQLLPISENETLFQLIGTTYGGDGQSTFALPNLSQRTPLHMGTGNDGINYQIGEPLGVETVTLTTQQIPLHSHAPLASQDPGTARNPGGLVLARGASDAYSSELTAQVMNFNEISPVGGSQPHENRQPYLVINFIISLFGIFPSQT